MTQRRERPDQTRRAPVSAREVLVFVGAGSLSRADLIESPGAPQVMARDEDSYEDGDAIAGL